MLAIAWPASVVGSTVGPILHTAPVRGGNVLLTRSGCQDVASLAALPGPAGAVIPGSQPVPDGLYAIPLRTVEQAAAGPLAQGRGNGHQATPTPASNPSTASSARRSSTANGNGNANGNANGKAAAKASKAAAKASAKASKAAAKDNAKGNGNGNG
jgi:hypothetical protein